MHRSPVLAAIAGLAALAAFILAVVVAASAVAANPDPAPPWYDEVPPLCGAPLNVELGVPCQPVDTSVSFVRDNLDCPAGLSQARLAGQRHTYIDLTYAEVIAPNGADAQRSIDINRAIEDSPLGAWSAWCVPATPAPVPIATATPAPTATPTPPPVVLPVFTGPDNEDWFETHTLADYLRPAAAAQTNGWQLPWDDYGNKATLTVPKCYGYCGVGGVSYW